MSILEMPVNELIVLYQQKSEATRSGDLNKLLTLKKDFPELFIKENEDAVNEITLYMKIIAESHGFKERLREEEKEKFIVLDVNQWKIGMVDDFINQHDEIRISLIRKIVKLMVKEAIIASIQIYQEHDINDASLEKVFPLTGLLLGIIIADCPASKRTVMLKSFNFKLKQENIKINNPQTNHSDSSDTYDNWKLSIKCYAEIQRAVSQYLVAMFDKVKNKFDQREGIYADCLYYSLLYITEFIALMSNNIAKMKGDTREDVLACIEKYLFIGIEEDQMIRLQHV